jgi:4-hydroxy-3-methylbut-2-enyl diphosphate reductase
MVDLAPTHAIAADAPAPAPVHMVSGAAHPHAAAVADDVRRRLGPGAPVALVGPAQPLRPAMQAGHVVVATEVVALDSGDVVALPAAVLVADELRRAGLTVWSGRLISSPEPLSAESAVALADRAVAWDTESAWLALALADHPVAVVRTLGPVDDGDAAGEPAVEVTAAVEAALAGWAAACGPHEVLLAGPRSFCAGVERAIEIVERALERFGRPVYVRRQIVHNAHVVADLEAKGAVFVTELGEVPDGSTVVLAAHGVSPAVRAEAMARGELRVIDATCPLVAKVHHEARRFLAQDYRVVLIGHAGHEEVEGTLGEGPERIHLVQNADDVAALPFAEGEEVAYLTQTTLAVDEAAGVVEALRARLPRLIGPAANDICYATQNRQDAVRALAPDCDLMLVVGSVNSSNTARLVEVARRQGCRAELIEDASQIELGWLAGATRIGVTAGASAPESLVRAVVEALGTLGPATVTEHATSEENVQFSLPRQVR